LKNKSGEIDNELSKSTMKEHTIATVITPSLNAFGFFVMSANKYTKDYFHIVK